MCVCMRACMCAHPHPLPCRSSISHGDWFDYMRPILDRALPAKLLDFLDFHAYTANAGPKVQGLAGSHLVYDAVEAPRCVVGGQLNQLLSRDTTDKHWK